MIVNSNSGTRLDEIADRLYRISTPVPPQVVPGGFSFNQYLLAADRPLLFHTGMRGMFPVTAEAIGKVMPIGKLRYVAFSHFESDECGALGQFLAAAPEAEPVCGTINAMINGDAFDRPAHALADGALLELGSHTVTWFDAAHLPHGWECGYLYESKTGTLLCGDLFTQGGTGETALTRSDILGPSEAMRRMFDYYAHAPQSGALLAKLAATKPQRLACMHGSAFEGDGAALLGALAESLAW